MEHRECDRVSSSENRLKNCGPKLGREGKSCKRERFLRIIWWMISFKGNRNKKKEGGFNPPSLAENLVKKIHLSSAVLKEVEETRLLNPAVLEQLGVRLVLKTVSDPQCE